MAGIMVCRLAMLFALFFAAAPSFAQYADKAPTAGVDTPASPEGALERQNQHDSVLADGQAANLPDVEISFPTSPTPPGGAGGLSLPFPSGQIQATNSYPHNSTATLQVDIRSNGSWHIEIGGSQIPTTNYDGYWIGSAPVAGVGADYDVTATMVGLTHSYLSLAGSCSSGGAGYADAISNVYAPRRLHQPTCYGKAIGTYIDLVTPATLSATRTFVASVSMLGNSAPADTGENSMQGALRITIKNRATGESVTSDVNFLIEAQAN